MQKDLSDMNSDKYVTGFICIERSSNCHDYFLDFHYEKMAIKIPFITTSDQKSSKLSFSSKQWPIVEQYVNLKVPIPGTK